MNPLKLCFTSRKQKLEVYGIPFRLCNTLQLTPHSRLTYRNAATGLAFSTFSRSELHFGSHYGFLCPLLQTVALNRKHCFLSKLAKACLVFPWKCMTAWHSSLIGRDKIAFTALTFTCQTDACEIFMDCIVLSSRRHSC